MRDKYNLFPNAEEPNAPRPTIMAAQPDDAPTVPHIPGKVMLRFCLYLQIYTNATFIVCKEWVMLWLQQLM